MISSELFARVRFLWFYRTLYNPLYPPASMHTYHPSTHKALHYTRPNTALSRACAANDTHCVKLLLLRHNGKACVNVSDMYSDTPLMAACKHGNVVSASLLLDAGAWQWMDVKNDFGSTALAIACHYGNIECAKLLVLRGAKRHDIAQMEGASWSADDISANSGHDELTDWLQCISPPVCYGVPVVIIQCL